MAGNKKVLHGLTYDLEKNRPLNAETLQVKVNTNPEKQVVNLFPLLYNSMTNNNESFLERNRLNVKILLGYISDIQAQYVRIYPEEHKLHEGISACVSNSNERISWLLTGIKGYNSLSKYKKSIKEFESKFQAIDLPKEIRTELFNMSAYQSSQFNYFESKETYGWSGRDDIPIGEINNDLLTSFSGNYQINYYYEDNKLPHYYIAEPYLINRQLVLNEFIANYAVMFYLSYLVRYKPRHLDELLDSKSAWLLESFINYSPRTTLRGLTSWVVEEDYILHPR